MPKTFSLAAASALTALALTAAPSLALAQTEAPPSAIDPELPPESAPPGVGSESSQLQPLRIVVAAPDHDATRLRFGFAGSWTYGLAQADNPRVSAVAFNPGLVLDLGAQFGDRFAAYARVETGTLLFFSQAALYGVFEWTPVHWLSLGTGVGYDAFVTAMFGSCSASSCTRTTWGGLSVPLVLGFNLSHERPEVARRSLFRIGLEGAAGVETNTGVFGWHAAVTFGYAAM